MKILPSRLGGPMNIGLQNYTIGIMAIARNIDDLLNWEYLEIDPSLRLPENWSIFYTNWKDEIK